MALRFKKTKKKRHIKSLIQQFNPFPTGLDIGMC